MASKKGQFLVDSEGRSYWTSSGDDAPKGGSSTGKIDSGPAQGQGEMYKVEEYTGELCRKDPVPLKPVAAMSYGQRVRIGRLYKSHEEFLGKVIKVAGWARTSQAHKNEIFIQLNDGSSFGNLQIVLHETSPYFEEISKTIVGASLSFTGTLIKSPAKGQEFEMQVTEDPAHKATLIGNSDGTYPIQGRPNIDVSFESSTLFNRLLLQTLRQQQHLRSRTNTFGAVARVRNSLAFATHQFFQTRGFLYIHTPIITASDCEGAGEMFAVTTVLPEAHDPVTKAKLQTQLKTPKSEEEKAAIAAKKKAEEEAAAKANEGKKKNKKDKKKK